MARLTALVVGLALASTGCSREAPDPGAPPSAQAPSPLDGPGLTGRLRLAVATPLRPVAEAQARWFGRLYPEAEVALTDTTARAALVALQRGDADAALLDRAPTADETEALRAVGLVPTEALVGAGAVVFVTAGDADSVRVADLADGRVPVAVASRNTGVTGTLAEAWGAAFEPVATFPTEAAVLEALPRRPAWVGAVSQPTAERLPAGLHVVALAGDGPAVRPRPRRVFEGEYPLVQRLTLVTVRRRDSAPAAAALGAGFARFAVGTRGQEAVLRAGWAPATLPERPVVLTPAAR